MNEQRLTVTNHKEVNFYGDELTAVQVEDGTIYIPVRQICERLGINWAAQTRRMRRDPVLSEAIRIIAVTTTNPLGGNPNMLCLPLKYISGFLFGISATRIKQELQEQLIRYQKECFEVLHEAFQQGRLTSDSTFDDLLERNSPAAQAFKMASAIMKMARQQLLLEAELKTHRGKLTNHEQRLEAVESQLGNPDRLITADQAGQISEGVKAVAHELGKQTGRNEYGGVYTELYRRFSVNSYKMLPANKFREAMSWLNSWLQALQDNNIAF